MTPIPSQSRKFALRRFALALALLLSLPLGLQATSITLQGGFGYPAAKAPDGSPLEPGHKVSIGTFPDGFDPAAHASDLPALLANWQQFHFGSTDTIDGDPGSFWLKHSSPTGTNLLGFSFPGKKIYLLLTRTTDGNPEPAADASNVRDFALFTSNHTSWTFPSPPSETNLPPGDIRNLNTSQITTAIAGTADPDTALFSLVSYSSPENPTDPGQTPSAFNQWLAATFPDRPDLTADSTVGPAGLSALATFALAADPAATAPPYTTVTDENGRIGIEFTRKTESASGFRTFAQYSHDLVGWEPMVNEVPLSSSDASETLRAFLPEGSDTSKAFFRIRVEPIQK
jgi:hypothetical protein